MLSYAPTQAIAVPSQGCVLPYTLQTLIAEPGKPPLGYSGSTMKLDPRGQSEPDTREQFKVGAKV